MIKYKLICKCRGQRDLFAVFPNFTQAKETGEKFMDSKRSAYIEIKEGERVIFARAK